ncbi:MAG: sugar ABC transporter permease [Clostridia bacterium]|nr:sugar ABC transporter permease [Clostridia bacterium]MBR5365053.1 sugar ABC transporter permease [Clostridia bacterium]
MKKKRKAAADISAEAAEKPEPKRIRLSKRERRERFGTSFFMIPSIAGVLAFFILPFLVVIYYSLIDDTATGDFVGLYNFAELFRNSAFKMALKNTGIFSLTAVPLVVVLSLALAVLLDANVPYKSTFRTIFLSPMIVPAASVILIWQVLFDFNGVVNDIIAFFGADPVEWLKSDSGYIVVVLLFLWKNIGYNMIMFMSALTNVPRDIIEVAMLDGCGSVRRFFTIKLRYLSSTISFVTIMSLINSFKVFREVYLLTGDYPFDSMYTLQHFMNNTFRTFAYQKLSAAAIILALAMIVIIGILLWIDDRAGRGIEE